MPQGKKGKGRSPEKGSQQVATYFLAKKSGLFTPGMATILANVPLVNSVKPVLGLRTQGQKASKWRGGGAGGSVDAQTIAAVDNVHWYLYGF